MNRGTQPSHPIREKLATVPAAGEDQIRYVLSPRFAIVAEALVPVVNSLREAMAQDLGLSRHEFVMPESLSHHLSVIQRVLERLPLRVEELINGGSANSEESDIQKVLRAAGRLEEVLSDWVEGFHEVTATHVQQEFGEVRDLLAGVYRHHLLEMCNWLADLIAVIANPAEAIEKAGLPAGEGETLSLSLIISVPPQMDELLSLAKRMQTTAGSEIESNPPSHHAAQAGPGVLGTLGALAFGIGVTEAVLGRNHG
jgi:hypothetical protein